MIPVRFSLLRHDSIDSLMWCAGLCTGYAMTSIEGRVAVEFFSESKQSKKYAFKCHRQVIEGTDTVYPVQGLTFNPVYVPPFSYLPLFSAPELIRLPE